MSSNESTQPNLINQGARILHEHSKTPHEMHNGRAKFECCARDVLALAAARISDALFELEGGTKNGAERAEETLNELVTEIEGDGTARPKRSGDAAAVDFARWIVSLDDPAGLGYEARRSVTMAQIISKAREAIDLPEEG